MTEMKHTILAGAVAGLLAAAPLGAQGYSGVVGYGGGAAWFGDFTESGPALALDDGWLAHAQGEYFMAGGRLGARLGAAFTQRPFQAPDRARDINTWMFDAAATLRPLPLRRGSAVSPFLAAGVGVISYGFGEGTPVEFEGADAVYPGDTRRQLTAVGGVGLDLVPRFSLFDTPLGLRLEVADHVALESPFESLDGEAHGPVHNVRVTIGLIGLVELP
jgi:hypothetical protein